MNLPKARTAEIAMQDLGKELLIYDLQSHQAYTLNESLKLVFEACDGQTSFDELKRQHIFTTDLIHLALAELRANDLLENYQSNHLAGLSRREAIRRVGLATMVTLPVIAGITAPTAAHAVSGTCTPGRGSVDAVHGIGGSSEACTCGYSSTNNGGYLLCNTTRGGLPDATGCKPGCLCQYTKAESGCPRGQCFGTCG